MKKRYARILAATLSAAMVFTSAPTAAFATELSVSEDAVEAEGVSPTEVNAEFPDVQIVYGQDKLFYDNGTGTFVAGASTTSLNASNSSFGETCPITYAVEGGRALDTILVGKSVSITLTMNVSAVSEPDNYFAGIETGYGYTYDNGKLVKKVTATCVRDFVTYAAGSEGIANDIYADLDADICVEPGAVNYVYGSDKVTAKTSKTASPGDYFASTNAKAAWKFVSVSPELKAAAVGTEVAKGAKFENVNEFDGTKIDTDKLIETLNEDTNSLNSWGSQKVVYSYANKKLYAEVAVTPTVATITAKDITWPSLPELKVGQDPTTIKLPDGSGGTFIVTGANATYDTALGYKTKQSAPINAAGDIYVAVLFTNKNTNVVCDGNPYPGGNIAEVSTTGYVKVYPVTVSKKVISDEDIKIIAKKKKFAYGDTYAELAATNLQPNTYVDYALTKKYVDKAAEELPVGKVTVEYTATLNDTYKDIATFADGTTTPKTFSVTYEVEAPELEAELTDTSNPVGPVVDIAKNDSLTLEAGLSDSVAHTVDTYQWYKNGSAIANATTNQYTVPTDTIGTATYYCVIKLTANPAATAAQRQAAESAIGTGVFTTPKTEIIVSEAVLANGISLSSGTQSYGAITANITETGAIADYVEGSAIAYVLAADGTKTSMDANEHYDGDYKLGDATAKLPTTLKPGTYTVVVEAKVQPTGEAKKSLRASATFVVTKGNLIAAGNVELKDGSAVKAELDKTSYVYGTKTSDMKLVYTNAYGTFKISDDNDEYYGVGTPSINVTFVPSAQTKELYETLDSNPWDQITDYNIVTEIKPAELVVAAAPVEIAVGETLPAAKATLKGLVAKDTVETLLYDASAEYVEGISEKVKVAGTYKDAVVPKFVNILDGTEYAGGITNYTIKFEKADVVVTDGTVKPSTPPTVAPTPAPVKQATAAAPKAAKAKATVKVGKKYTLKLKYAAGKKATVKKVTWKSSKKSVATVSSKGKVTAKKAGKATITATITFKDGSKKKVKFTVTVK